MRESRIYSDFQEAVRREEAQEAQRAEEAQRTAEREARERAAGVTSPFEQLKLIKEEQDQERKRTLVQQWVASHGTIDNVTMHWLGVRGYAKGGLIPGFQQGGRVIPSTKSSNWPS